MKPLFYQQLESFLGKLHRRQRCGIIIAMLLATVLDLWIVSCISQWTGIREFTALMWVSIILLAGLAVGITLLFIHQKDKAGIRQIVGIIEQEYPDLMDTLNTAIDLHALPESHQLAFTRGVFQKADTAIEHLPWRKALIPAWLKPGSLLSGFVVAMLLIAAISQTELLRKAGHGWLDWRTGINSGVQIQPEQLGIPRDSDITIRAEIMRWEDIAQIQYQIDGENFRFPMSASRDGDRNRNFTFYQVSEPIHFRVITPSLVSNWKEITAYTPPHIETAVIEVNPPAYTRIDPFKLNALDNLQVPEGSKIRVSLSTRYTEELAFQTASHSEAFQREIAEIKSVDPVVESHHWQYIFKAESNKTWNLHLANEDVATESAQYRLEVIPDERPVVEILKPGRDIQLEPAENLYLEVYAADDYGLSAMVINLSIAGRFREQIPIRPRGLDGEREPLETSLPTAVDFSTLDVEEGELVSYWVTVSDNREPDPQHTRSEVYFVEVRTEQEPEEADGMQEDEERINLRAHIEEMKRLIRLSHRAVSSLDPETRLERNQQITSGLNNLRSEINEIFEDIRPQLEEMGDRFFTRGFESVDGLLSSAGRLVTENQTESAIGTQEQALQELIAMENALRRETISREPSDSESGESGEGMEGESESEPSSMADLRDIIEELQSLSDAQNTLNNQADRAGRVGSEAEELQQLRDQQDDLRQQTRELERSLQDIDGFGDVANIIGEGSRRMREAAEQLRRQDPQRAWRDGIRALDALETAARILQDRVDQASQRALESLENQARQLAQQQGQAAGESGEAAQSGGDSNAMLNRQQQLNEDWQELLEQMDALAREMASSNPETSRALNQTARSAQQGDPGNSMTRAANALLYERFAQAEGLQETAAQALDEIAKQIREAGGSMSALSAEQLQRLIEELGRDQQSLSSLETPVESEDAERMDEIREQWSERLEQLGQQMGDGPLNGIANALGESGDGEADARLGESIELLLQAEASLRQYRDLLQRRQFFQSQRRSAPPPEQYRQQVESYFRRLAEEDEQ